MKYQQGMTKVAVVILVVVFILASVIASTAYRFKQQLDPSRENIGILKEEPKVPIINFDN